MKKNAGRLSKKVFAAMMAGTLMTAMVGMNVSAQAERGGINVNKVVTTDSNTYAPNTTFKFDVKAAEVNEGETFFGDVVYDGVEGGLTEGEGAAFTPEMNGMATESGFNYAATDYITVKVNKFDIPGVYKYTVTEEKGNYDGIIYDTTSYDVYVYVFVNESTGKLYVGDIVSAINGEKSELIFGNDYGQLNDTTHDVIITKDVTGNQGNKNKDFTFKVTVTGENGEKYKVVVNDNVQEATSITSGQEAEFTLSDGDTIQIYGLSENDKVKVDELDYSDDGYTTTYKSSGTSMNVINNDEKSDYIEGTITADGATITVENNKEVSAPTGIAMTYGPYALMVALAGGMAVLFFRRRNREDY